MIPLRCLWPLQHWAERTDWLAWWVIMMCWYLSTHPSPHCTVTPHYHRTSPIYHCSYRGAEINILLPKVQRVALPSSHLLRKLCATLKLSTKHGIYLSPFTLHQEPEKRIISPDHHLPRFHMLSALISTHSYWPFRLRFTIRRLQIVPRPTIYNEV